jgi:ADP-heptose:LPS heptosyltransferase
VRAAAPHVEKTGSMTFHRILLLNRNHIGDCLFTTPAIRALRTAYPEADLVAAVPAINRDLLIGNPCLTEVMVRPPRGARTHLRWLQEIRRRRFDLVISFQEKSFFYAALARLSGARLTVSLQHWRTRPFYHRIVPVVPGRHEVEKYHAIAQAVLGPGGPEGDDEASWTPGAMELHVVSEHRARADRLLGERGIDPMARLVGINPGATMPVKRWPVERFATLGRELFVRHGARALVLGGPDDRERAAAIARAVPGAVSVAGHTRLGETAALLLRCRLLISGDTGPLHMAVALGVPVVGMFGPTNPYKYGPWSEQGAARRRASVLRHAEPCPECDRPCVHAISVEECLSAAESWLCGESPASTSARAAEVSGRSERRIPAMGHAL